MKPSPPSKLPALACESCAICGLPAYPEQGLHGATGNHWACEEERREEFVKVARRAELALAYLEAEVKKLCK